MIRRLVLMARGQAAEVPERGSAYAWFVAGLWMLCSLVGFVVVFNIGILLPAISDDLLLSPSQQGILGSAAFWGNLALAVPIGWWTARMGPKAVVGATLVLSAGLLFFQGWGPVFGALLAGRLLFGICLLALEPPGALLIQQWFPPDRIVFVNSVNNLFFGIIMGAGSAITPLLLKLVEGQWRLTFYIYGACFIVLAVLWVLLASERKATVTSTEVKSATQTGLLAGALKHKDMWVAGFGFLGATTGWSAFLSFFPTLALEEHGLSLQWSGVILAAGLVAGGVSGMVTAYILRTRNLRREVLVVMGLTMAGGYAAMTFTGTPGVLVLLSFLSGVGGGYFPVLYSVPFLLPAGHPKQVSVGVAFVLTSVSLGTVLGPLITGFLEEFTGDLKTPLLIVGLSGLTLSVSGLFLSPLKASQKPGPVKA